MIKIAKKIPRYKKWISSSKGGVMFISPEWSKVMLWLPYPGATIPDPVLPPDQKKNNRNGQTFIVKLKL